MIAAMIATILLQASVHDDAHLFDGEALERVAQAAQESGVDVFTLPHGDARAVARTEVDNRNTQAAIVISMDPRMIWVEPAPSNRGALYPNLCTSIAHDTIASRFKRGEIVEGVLAGIRSIQGTLTPREVNDAQPFHHGDIISSNALNRNFSMVAPVPVEESHGTRNFFLWMFGIGGVLIIVYLLVRRNQRRTQAAESNLRRDVEPPARVYTQQDVYQQVGRTQRTSPVIVNQMTQQGNGNDFLTGMLVGAALGQRQPPAPPAPTYYDPPQPPAYTPPDDSGGGGSSWSDSGSGGGSSFDFGGSSDFGSGGGGDSGGGSSW